MKRFLACCATFLPLAVVLPTVAAYAKPDIVLEKDIVYGKGGDTQLRLDLAMPKHGKGPFPAIVFLHGGGWRGGKRQQMDHFIQGAARLGYVGVTVSYRLVPAARFPAQIEDCKAAVRYLRANARKYKINPDRIGAVGFSAGGHLACLLGAADRSSGLEGSGGNAEQSSRVQAVVSFFGPTDFTTRDWPADLEKSVLVPFLGGTLAEKADTYKKASPITYATRDDPPFLFFHGTKDKLVPVDQSKRMAKKLQSVGASAKLVVFEGESHGFSDATNQKAMKQMLAFLAERLKK
jgi:acetyl esterase/lipase